MAKNIVVTGAHGFIGSVIVQKLSQDFQAQITAVDDLGTEDKWKNVLGKSIERFVGITEFLPLLESDKLSADLVIHMGACSSTTERDADYLLRNNTLYSQRIFEYCTKKNIPLIYASSAATYGGKESQFVDDHGLIPELRPLNKYGFSKHIFDLWALRQQRTPPFWIGLKFFNVYGPNEYHKGGQASVVFHAFNQAKSTGKIKLFKSYREGIAHGMQQRDFIYVSDIANVISHLCKNTDRQFKGIYNLGTGKARSFKDLAEITLKEMKLQNGIEWIDMPEGLRNQYQYFTEADMSRFRRDLEYREPFTTLEDGIKDYVDNYLQQGFRTI
jgi:ADP-L-glycero-D-manno-heptose 6-epimerase